MHYRYLFIAAAGIATTSHAAETTAPLVVTATRTPVTADDALAATTVITRADIERHQPADVPALLRGLAGVSITRSGGRGKITSVHLRGTNGDHTLVLVDGVRVGSATAGSAPLEQFPVSQIQRIEVVRGPRASLYGADAVGGVIQIFTRSDHSHVNLAAGDKGTWELATGLGHQGEHGGFSASVSGLSTEGFDATDANNFGHEPDKDGYSSRAGSLAGHYTLTDTLTVRAHAMRVESDNEFDGAVNETDNTQQAISGELDWMPTDAWRSRLSLGTTLDDSDSRLYGGDRFITQRHTATWQNDLFFAENHVTTLGVDYYDEQIQSALDYNQTSRDNLAVFAQHQWYAGPFDLQGAVRHDDNEAYGGETTGSIAAGYAITTNLRGYISWGTAFKAPTFNDLYYPDTGFFKGNPDLDPEQSRTWEIGIEGNGDWQWRLAAFHTQVDDLIAFDAASTTSVNVNDARIRGVEGEISHHIAGFDTRLAVTWLDTEDSNTGNELPRRPSFAATAGISRTLGPARLGTEIHYGGDRYDDLGNTSKLNDYTVVDFTAAWHLNDTWTLRGRIANLLDEDYQTVKTYNMPGRTVLVSINWQSQ